VIEQASMVLVGRRLAQAYRLPVEFLDSQESAIPPLDVLIFSSVLQYLPDPWGMVESLLRRSTPAVVILDRTAIRRGPSRWYLQTNPGYYQEPVSYPVQVLEQRRLLAAFHGYRPVRHWHNDFDPRRPEHIGMLLLRDDTPGAKE
jgi:putative methyltransferase (TIGR04325 family)